MSHTETPPPLGVRRSFLVFGSAAIVAILVVEILLPALAERVGAEPPLPWFAAAALVLFPALLLIGWALLRSESIPSGGSLWRDRLRFRPMSGSDWAWSAGALALVGAASAALMGVLIRVRPDTELAPWFLDMEPLSGGRLWILAVWLPVFALGILTEEIVWRGVVLPRQEAAFGRWGWAANGAGWLLFHLAFGPAILISLVPTVTILPWVVQRRANSTVGLVVHAVFNGLGFLATAFGWV